MAKISRTGCWILDGLDSQGNAQEKETTNKRGSVNYDNQERQVPPVVTGGPSGLYQNELNAQ